MINKWLTSFYQIVDKNRLWWEGPVIQPSEVEDRKIPPTLTISQISEQRIRGVKSEVTKVIGRKFIYVRALSAAPTLKREESGEREEEEGDEKQPTTTHRS